MDIFIYKFGDAPVQIGKYPELPLPSTGDTVFYGMDGSRALKGTVHHLEYQYDNRSVFIVLNP